MLRLQKDRNLSRFEAEVSASIMGVDIDKLSVDEYGVISNTGKTLNQVLRMANHKDLPDAVKLPSNYGYIFNRLKWVFKHYTYGNHYFWIVPKSLMALINDQQDYLRTLTGTGQYYRIQAKPVSKSRSLRDQGHQLKLDNSKEYTIHIFNNGLSAFYFVECPDQPADLVVYEAEPSKLRNVFQIPETAEGFIGMYD